MDFTNEDSATENLKYHFDALDFIIFSMFGVYKS